MNDTLTRRRFLTISAAAVALPSTARAEAPAVSRWHGRALGAAASMTLVGVAESPAQAIFAAVEDEIARLEAIFSLHRPGSALNRLNESGSLSHPPAELLELIGLSGTIYRASGGAFDPTVQPLWLLLAKSAAEGRAPQADELTEARRHCGWGNLHSDTRAITFARQGMAMTFNGIAQGFIADRVAALIRARGLTDVLIDTGEIAALGRRPDGTPWRAGIATPDGEVVREVRLGERALATSAPLGTLLDRSGRVGHILDPRSGRPSDQWQLVSVSAKSAALADGLSTAFCLMTRDEIDGALERFPSASLEVLI